MSALAHAIGKNIKAARQAARLTQESLAEAVELDFRSISRIERGNALPSLTTLEAIANRLDVGLTELLAGAVTSRSEIAQELEGLLSVLPQNKQQAVLDIMRKIIAAVE